MTTTEQRELDVRAVERTIRRAERHGMDSETMAALAMLQGELIELRDQAQRDAR